MEPCVGGQVSAFLRYAKSISVCCPAANDRRPSTGIDVERLGSLLSMGSGFEEESGLGEESLDEIGPVLDAAQPVSDGGGG